MNTPAAICPDSSGTGIEPHIMGDYAEYVRALLGLARQS